MKIKPTYQALESENKALRKELENLKRDDNSGLLLDMAGVIFVQINTQGAVTLVNKKALTVFGYRESEMLGKNWFENFVPKHCKKKLYALSKQILTGKFTATEYYENPILTKTGKERLIRWHNTPIRDKTGRIIGHLSSGEDITARRKAEIVLRESREYFKTLIENSSDVIVILDAQGNSLYRSPSYERVMGYSPYEKNGNNVFEQIHIDDRDRLREQLAKSFQNRNRIEKISFRAHHKDGSLRYLQGTGRNMLDIPYVKGIVINYRDVTPDKHAEKKLRQRENYLSALNRAKQILLSSDASNPIQQFVDTLGVVSNASRVYVFINHIGKAGEFLMSQKAEYCAPGIKPEIDNPELQNLNYNIFFSRWRETLSKGELIVGMTKDFPKSEKDFLQLQSIQSILIIPIMLDSEFVGFIGFDNCVSEKEWDTAEQNFLRAAANDLAQFIVKKRMAEQQEAEFNRFQTTLDALDAFVYVADIQTYELLFVNKAFNNLYPGKIGKKCYSVIQKEKLKACKFCTNHLLLDAEGKPGKPHVWEFQNVITKRWYQCRDQAIRWTNGKLVRIEIATDITERKNTELALEESEKMFKHFFTANKAVMIRLDPRTKKIIAANKAAVEFYGYPSRILLQKSMYDLNILSKDKVDSLMQKALHEKSNYFQFQHRLADGSTKIVEVYASPVKVKDKLFMFAIIYDITERKKTELSLQKSEQKYRLLSETSSDVIIVHSMDGRLTYINRAGILLSGYTVQEILTMNIVDFVTPKSAEQMKNRYKKRKQVKKGVFLYEVEFKNKKADIFYLEISSSPIITGDKIEGILIIGRNISARKKTEQALRESEKRFKAFSEATFEGLIFTDKGIVLDANEALLKMAGCTHEELIGRQVIDFIAFENKELVRKNIATAYEKPYDATVLRKDGTKFYAEFHARMFNYKGRQVRVTAVRDISRRIENERLLKKSKAELEKMNKHLTELVQKELERSREKDRMMLLQSRQAAMGEMIGSIAHQWRQPLNEIGLYLQSLQEKYEYGELTDKNLNKTVEQTMRKLEYMSQTIDDFRNFFSSDKAKERFSLTDSVKKALLLTKASFKNNKIKVFVSLQENLCLVGYSNEFSQAVLNVLNNAKDALIERQPAKARIKISLLKKDKKLILSISDNAGGIADAFINRIFEPYFSTKSETEGTGLGLYISKTIIERNMGGKLTVANTEYGAKFKIKFKV